MRKINFTISLSIILLLSLPLLSVPFMNSALKISASENSEWCAGDVYRGSGCGSACDSGCNSGDKTVALTFDDGPHETKTDEILSILDEYDVKATFFMIGKNIELYPEIAVRVLKSGHEIGNHTYSHGYLSSQSLENIIAEIDRDNDILRSVNEYTPHFLRPPGGIYDKNVISAAKSEDMVIALWSIDTLDWCHKSCNEIVSEVLENISDGDIILMHDYVSGTSHTAEALKIIIPELLKKGYKFVTLSDMYLNYR